MFLTFPAQFAGVAPLLYFTTCSLRQRENTFRRIQLTIIDQARRRASNYITRHNAKILTAAVFILSNT